MKLKDYWIIQRAYKNNGVCIIILIDARIISKQKNKKWKK